MSSQPSDDIIQLKKWPFTKAAKNSLMDAKILHAVLKQFFFKVEYTFIALK